MLSKKVLNNLKNWNDLATAYLSDLLVTYRFVGFQKYYWAESSPITSHGRSYKASMSIFHVLYLYLSPKSVAISDSQFKTPGDRSSHP